MTSRISRYFFRTVTNTELYRTMDMDGDGVVSEIDFAHAVVPYVHR